jgi:Undecaprenyl-phosphate glucose phosphotransferase
LYAWGITFALLLLLAFSLKITSYYSRVWAVSWFLASAGLLPLCRLLLERWIQELARDGRFAQRTVIVGAGEQGQVLADHLAKHDDGLTRIVGFIDDPDCPDAPDGKDHHVLGDINHLIGIIRNGMVDQVVIALPWDDVDRLNRVIHQISVTPARICVAPDLRHFRSPNASYREVGGVEMLQVLDRPISGWSHILKTIEDRILALFFILFTGPLMLLIALAIKIDSRGPVFFRQARYGFNDTLISVWKFRTMYTDMADADCEVQTIRDDPRITRVGRLLRRTSMDELPQFFNVVAGDMSVVGPRPHAMATKVQGALFADIVDRYAARHRVKPGITGWAQVNGWRGETDTVEKLQNRIEHDLYYIDHWSIWFDLMIILRTVVVLLRDENAY